MQGKMKRFFIIALALSESVMSLPLLTGISRNTESVDSMIRTHSSFLVRQRAKADKNSFTTKKSLSTITLRAGSTMRASISPSAPSLSVWITPALLCAFSYAFYNLSIKKASSSIDHMLGGVFLQIIAALLGGILLTMKLVFGKGSLVITKRSGVIWSIVAGIAVGTAEILSFYVSSKGVQAMQSIPVIVGGSVLFGSIMGRVWLKEVISIKGWVGVLLISCGIALTACN